MFLLVSFHEHRTQPSAMYSLFLCACFVPAVVMASPLASVSASYGEKLKQECLGSLHTELLGTEYNPLPSCDALPADKPAGYYWVKPSTNQAAVQAYCSHGSDECGGTTGWTRVGHLDMSNPAENCPGDWTLHSLPPRTCGSGNDTSKGCHSVIYPASGIMYSRVCGRVVAYHTGGSDAFRTNHIDLESNYIDGISLTHGPENSRQHIWSFVNAVGEVGNFETEWLCDCSNGDEWPHSTGVVGNNYFCDTGNPAADWSCVNTYLEDPLWEGKGCGPASTCCQFNNPPWFSVTLPGPTSDDLEVRNCRLNPGLYGFDNLVQLIEIYVK